MITVTYLSPRRVCRHTCSSTPMTCTPVEPGRVVDQHPLALGQDRVVGGVPRHPEAFGDPGDGQVLDHERLQRPPQPTARQLRPRLGRAAGVLAPHVPAAGAPVAADRDQQRRRTPAQRLVRQPPDHACPAASLRSRSGGTTWSSARRPGRPAPPGPAPGAARSPPGRARPGGRTWSGQGSAKVASGTSRSSGWAA